MRMKMKMKVAAMGVVLWAMCYSKHAYAQPQNNYYLEPEWNTSLPPVDRHSVGFNTNGQIIVGSYTADIMVFETNGTLVRSWAANVQDLDVSTNGLIFAVVGTGAGTVVRVYDTLGTLVRSWPLGFTSYGIGVGRNGIVYVSDNDNSRVVAYDLQGSFVRQWGSPGSIPSQFDYAADVFVSLSGQVYVCDAHNLRIQLFGPEGEFRGSINGYYPVRVAVSADELTVLSNYGTAAYSVGSFSPDGQLRYAVEGGKIRIYRRTYSTPGLRLPNAIPVPLVLKTEQRAGTTLVDVDFTVLDPDNSMVNVAAVAFINGRTDLASLIRMTTFEEGTSSAVGTNVTTDVKHRLTWNAAADWSTNFVNAQVEILAKDNRGLLDFHFLTIPVPQNLPPLTISQFPVNAADMLNAWVWLIASGNTNVLLTNGNVKGLSGAYSGKMLTSTNGTTTTADGRAFLFSLVNVREATTDEYNRANGSGVQWTPRLQIAGRPAKVNEYGFDTGASGYWVVPLP